MRSKLLHESDGQKTYALIFETGDEVMSNLKTFARDNRLGSSHFTAIGAFQNVTLGYFDWAKVSRSSRKTSGTTSSDFSRPTAAFRWSTNSPKATRPPRLLRWLK